MGSVTVSQLIQGVAAVILIAGIALWVIIDINKTATSSLINPKDAPYISHLKYLLHKLLLEHKIHKEEEE